jgi:hypothetical protein
MDVSLELIHTVKRRSDRKASPAVRALIDEIRDRHGEAVQGVLFYGSCLRSGDDLDGLVDLYLLVDNYRSAYKSRMQSILNAMLPPNVYYLERELDEQVVRTKYAVLSLADLEKGTSRRWFHSYLWGRFCQPTALVYARDEAVRDLVSTCFGQAVLTFVRRVLPQIDDEFSARQLWSRGLTLSYGAELRSEKPQKRARLFDAAPEYYKTVTRLAADALSDRMQAFDGPEGLYFRQQPSVGERLVNRISWRIRAWQGKLLSILRLLKATLTFEGGVDYILWKIERHSGVTVEVEPWLKRRPLLAIWVLSWRLYRKGGFR